MIRSPATARTAAVVLSLAAAVGCGPAATAPDSDEEALVSQETPQSLPPDWPWPDALDAVAAAPDSHEILLENEEVRVVRVKIPPGVREPRHTHRWPSVMIVDHPARIRYFDADGELRFESPEEIDRTPRGASWLAPEGPHSVENIDSEPYFAYRVELKAAAAASG